MDNKWLDNSSEVRKGEEIDLSRLKDYLSRELPEFSGAYELRQFPRGFSNLTYLLKIGDHEFVMRRPPHGANIKSAHDMGREYKILQALSKTYPKAPKPYIYCEDLEVMGSPFYIMERVKGVILRPKMPKEMIPDADTMRGIAEGLVDTLVELHEVDYRSAGLGDLGKPEGYVERQITGWTRRYFKSKTDDIQAIEHVAKWLNDNIPGETSPSLIHNDYKYDNLVLDSKDWTKVIAVLDWEMTTIGDPLMDLGTTIGYWVNADDPDWVRSLALSPTTLPGNPSREEVVHMYSLKSGKDVGNVVFYYVYGIFKVAVIAQQIYYRYKHGFTNDDRFAPLIDAVKGLGMIASQAIAHKRIDRLF